MEWPRAYSMMTCPRCAKRHNSGDQDLVLLFQCLVAVSPIGRGLATKCVPRIACETCVKAMLPGSGGTDEEGDKAAQLRAIYGDKRESVSKLFEGIDSGIASGKTRSGLPLPPLSPSPSATPRRTKGRSRFWPHLGIGIVLRGWPTHHTHTHTHAQHLGTVHAG